MYYGSSTAGSYYKPTQPAAQNYTVPASVGGVNALDPLIAIPPQDCFYTYNLMPSEYGLRLRKGYREWATGVGSSNTEVRTILPFQGQDPTNNKLFAVCPDGIYDVTTDQETSPTQDVSFSTTSGKAGYGVWTEMTLDTGAQVLFYADGENGLHQYTESSGSWSVPSFTGGVTVADIAFVILHKQRLWVVEKESGDAWYGPVDAISGDFTKFTFGSKFRYGGELLALANWTLDGGDGVDDYLVAISRAGDVLTYRGPDPSDAAWTLTGSYFVGEMPDSRRCTQDYGGQLFILSTFGIVSLHDLTQGVDIADIGKSVSAKINRILRGQVIQKKDTAGWMLTIHPADGFLQILEPWSNEVDAIQYNQNLLTRAWGYWRNVPAKCAESWQAEYYMGGDDGQVYVYDGQLDNTTISGGAGSAIDFSILTSFQAVGDHATYKQNGMIRVVATQSGDVSYNIKSVYDYDILAAADAPSGNAATSPSTWDNAVWGSAKWDGEVNGAFKLEGGNGIGRTLAVAMKGESQSRITVVGWDLTVTTGGYL